MQARLYSCMKSCRAMRWNSSFLENASDLRTNRPSRCRNVLFQRSMCAFLTHRLVIFAKYGRIGLPEIAVGLGLPVSFRKGLPKRPATVGATVAGEPGDNLPGPAA